MFLFLARGPASWARTWTATGHLQRHDAADPGGAAVLEASLPADAADEALAAPRGRLVASTVLASLFYGCEMRSFTAKAGTGSSSLTSQHLCTHLDLAMARKKKGWADLEPTEPMRLGTVRSRPWHSL